VTVARLATLEDEAGGLLGACALALERKMLSTAAAEKVGAFLSLIESLRRRLHALSYPELTQRIITQTGYDEMLRETDSPEARDRLQNLEELLKGMQEHASTGQNLSEYLEQVALVTDLDAYDDTADRVTLMTLHSAKGLEFPVVFMVGMEEGLFPHARATDGDIEEERRLCYVGMTRAMETLHLTHARRRRLYAAFQENRPSCFLTEIPGHLAQHVGGRAEAEPATRCRSPRRGGALSWSADEEVRVVHDTEDGLRVGAQVRHASFGIGTVQGLEGRGESRKVTVAFRRAGTRKLVLKFAGLMPA
jgi:DNA helicase-2/ATP-dependent DNA helicase PcrA